MLSEVVGEVKVWDRGGGYGGGVKEGSGRLGLVYEWNYRGKGMKVEEVVEKGGFEGKSRGVKGGVVIEKIEGEGVDGDLCGLVKGKGGKKILV